MGLICSYCCFVVVQRLFEPHSRRQKLSPTNKERKKQIKYNFESSTFDIENDGLMVTLAHTCKESDLKKIFVIIYYRKVFLKFHFYFPKRSFLFWIGGFMNRSGKSTKNCGQCGEVQTRYRNCPLCWGPLDCNSPCREQQHTVTKQAEKKPSVVPGKALPERNLSFVEEKAH